MISWHADRNHLDTCKKRPSIIWLAAVFVYTRYCTRPYTQGCTRYSLKLACSMSLRQRLSRLFAFLADAINDRWHNERRYIMVQKGMLFLLALLIVLAGCGPPQVVCLDFEPPLTLSTQYGSPAGQSPGDIAFTTNGIPVSVWEFVFTNGGGTFNLAQVDTAPVAFGSGQSMRLNNLNLEFNFSQVGFQVSQVKVEFLDLGGFENLSVNSNPNPPFAGEFSAAPNPIGGIGLAVNTVPVTGGTQGTLTLTGQVDTLRIGGQELWIDNVCVQE